jgi:hypothetical protein
MAAVLDLSSEGLEDPQPVDHERGHENVGAGGVLARCGEKGADLGGGEAAGGGLVIDGWSLDAVEGEPAVTPWQVAQR